MSWLPEGIQEPKSQSAYLKLQDGENKIRILSQPIVGWEDWDGNKPVRYRYDNKPAKSIDPTKEIKLFYTFLVWDYASEKIKILSVTQATIRKKLAALSTDEDWGQPYFYDIKIIRTGKDKLTDYQVNPSPHKQLPDIVAKAFYDKPCNLEALFDNGDPWALGQNQYTRGIFTKDDLPMPAPAAAKPVPQGTTRPDCITKQMADDLREILDDCNRQYCEKIWKTLNEMSPSITKLEQVPVSIYDKLLAAATKNRKEHQESLAKQDANDLPF